MTETIPQSAVIAYLEAIEASGVLGKSARRLELFRYLIKTELRGDGDSLKAYTIGIDALGKADDFDPTTDSSVRVEMGRLRAALTTFETGVGADQELTVDIPVGSYRPTLTQRHATETPTTDVKDNGRWPLFAAVIAMVLVGITGWFATGRDTAPAPPGDYAVIVSIDPFSGDAALTSQVEATLRRNLVRTSAIFTIPGTGDTTVKPDFSLRGFVSPSGNDSNRVNVELLSKDDGQIVWAKTVDVPAQDDIEQQVAQQISNDLRVRLLGASKEFLARRDLDELTPQQLFVMATWVPGPATNAIEWELERVALIDRALAIDPDFGAAHSVMADKLSYLANVHAPSDTKALRDRAAMHGRRALELAPLDADVMFNVAQSHWHAGRIAQSHATMLRVLDLDPGHDLARFLSQVIPYTCTTPSPQAIQQAVSFDQSLSQDNPIRWLTLTWIGWLHVNAGDYESALDAEQRAALIFEVPYSFMRHAMVLVKLGRPDEAAEIIRRQATNWPDISPDHYAAFTQARLCSEEPQGEAFIQNYVDLAAAMADRL